jgi:hypothetical protein
MEEWVKEVEGENKKYYREKVLNDTLNRWGLNKASSVGKTSELIRKCSPDDYQQWVNFYFKEAFQEKKNGMKITKEFLKQLGEKLFEKIKVVQEEISQVTEEECIDYVENLIVNRTFEGYMTEKQTIYEQLQKLIMVEIKPAPDEWDRIYNVDFYCQLKKDYYIGIQVKPVSFVEDIQHNIHLMHENSRKKFKEDFGGSVYYIYSVKKGDKKVIANPEIVDYMKKEIESVLG